MGERREGAMAWVRGLVGGRGQTPPRFPGKETSTTGLRAILAVEQRISEALVRQPFPGLGPDASHAANAFGRQVPQCIEDDPGALIDSVIGRTSSGVRTGAILRAERLDGLQHRLRCAAESHVPLVLHAVCTSAAGHEALHASAECGLFVFVARDAQAAADLTLLARRVAEMTLTPGIVALDAGVPQELRLPESDLVREYVGDPSGEVASPTPAQTMLFGERRRRLVRAFDPDRPTAAGLTPEGADLDAAAAGRRVFFDDSLATAAAESLDAFLTLVGRAHPPVHGDVPDDAQHVIVVSGAALVPAIEAATAHGSRGARIGVLGLTRLHPFPAAEIRRALRGTRCATVIEATTSIPPDAPPGLRGIRAALGEGGPRLLSATTSCLTAGAIDEVIHNMLAGDRARATIRLGIVPPARKSSFPRRDAMLQRIRRDYPALDALTARAPHEESAGASELPVAGGGESLPLAVRRFEGAGSTHDSVSRFWGELIQPRREGESGAVPDPYLAYGTAPACTSTFEDVSPWREHVPLIDPDRCTGCGRCWVVCPDSALAPVALGTEALLDACADRAREGAGAVEDEPAKKIRRAHRQLAARVDRLLADRDATVPTLEILREAFDWVVEKMKVDETELPAYRRSFEPVAEEVARLRMAATSALFHDAHREEKGNGALLQLAVDPRACQGCGLCAAACDDEAIAMTAPTVDLDTTMRRTWDDWERLPDTSGPVIARAAKHPRIGVLASVLLSRHTLFSLAGGHGAEPGSGERMAVRQIVAAVEYSMQRRMVEHSRVLKDLETRLRETIRKSMADAVPLEDLAGLDRALEATPGRSQSLGRLLDRLEETDGQADLDASYVRDLVRVARRIEQARWRIESGPGGMGRARFGVVVAGDAAGWATRFPRNPFSVPLAVDRAGNGVDLALGLLQGNADARVEEARLVRLAELLLENPADRLARERELETLRWVGLTSDERATCPPVLIFVDAGVTGAAALARLAASDLPAKAVVLDDRDLVAGGADAALVALANRSTFVVSTSVAHSDHLLAGVTRAIENGAGAAVHVHVPKPGRHGFPADRTLERAEEAVACRVHPLLVYDPQVDGVFGLRLSIGGNVQPDRAWAQTEQGEDRTPARWLAGEARYEALAADEAGRTRIVEERAGHWAVLQELAGVVTPFTEKVRERMENELREAHRAEIETLRAEHAARVEELERGQLGRQADRLRARLLQLAGYGRGHGPS